MSVERILTISIVAESQVNSIKNLLEPVTATLHSNFLDGDRRE